MKDIKEIEKIVDKLNLSPQKKRRKRKMSRKMMIATAIVVGCFVITASAGLLQYYGQVSTTATVEQSVRLWYGDNYVNWDSEITGDDIDTTAGNCEYAKHRIKNFAGVDAPVALNTEVYYNNAWRGVDTLDSLDMNQYIVGDYQTIELRQKNVDIGGTTPWTLVGNGDTIGADLTIKNCRNGFWYELDYWGLTEDTYSLVYYANYPDYWEIGQVEVIDTFTISGSSSFDRTVSNVDSFPYENDENAITGIANQEPDYTHEYGAKLWLVPSEAIDSGEINWNSVDNVLWETDLALFVNCGFDVIDIPNVYEEFSVDVLQPGTEYCILLEYCFNLKADPVFWQDRQIRTTIQ